MRTRSEIKNRIEEIGYIFIDEYIDDKGYRYVLAEDKDGYKYDFSFHNIDKEKSSKPSIVSNFNPNSLYNISVWLKNNNKNFLISEDNVYKNAHSKLKFYCLVCNDYFYSGWNSILSNYGCGICSGMQVGKYNNLAYLRPDLCLEWHPTKNGDLTPFELSEYSNVNVWWICKSCQYEWKTTLSRRTNRGCGCPSCSNPPKVLTDKSRLSILYPEISKEWNYNKNNNLTPENIFYGSGKKVWWCCDKGHEWISSVNTRTNFNTGCPICSFSKGENKLNNILLFLNKNFTYQYRFFDCRNKSPLPFDFYLPDYNLCIEYHGEQHYEPVDFAGKGIEWAKEQFKNNKKRDKIKLRYCKDNNIPLLIIPYWDFDNIEDILSDKLNLLVEGI